MRIALYGDSIAELQKREEKLRKLFHDNVSSYVIEYYTDEQLLSSNVLRYDFICMTDQVYELCSANKRHEVTFSHRKKIDNCYLDDIYYVEADLKNVHIHFKKNELMVQLPFSEVSRILEVGDFIKVHRSYLVNCMYIQSMNETFVCLKNGVELPISKYRTKAIHEEYMHYLKEL